jgi:hypothetical protein
MAGSGIGSKSHFEVSKNEDDNSAVIRLDFLYECCFFIDTVL